MASHDQILRAVVAAHERFFADLLGQGATQLPASAWTWIGSAWTPWFERWESIVADGEPLADHLVSAVSKSLSELRASARDNGVPLPELSPYATPPADAAPNSAAALPMEIARETDRRFREETGWPEGRKIDPHREASMLRRWLQIRYQVVQEIATAQG